MDMSNTILDSLVKGYGSNKVELLQNTEKLKSRLVDYLPAYIEAEDFMKKILPKSSGTLISQKAQLTLTQLDNNLQPVDNTLVEVNSICIEEIRLDMQACGFFGKVAINLPYSTFVPEDYAILFENKPLLVELELTSNFRCDETNPPPKEKSVNNVIKLKGIASLNKGISHKHYFSENDQQSLEANKPYFDSYISIGFEFYDVLQAFWDVHFPVKIYQDSSYQDIFTAENKTFQSLINLLFDETATKFTTKRPFITLNCDYQKQYSFYDFLSSALNDYGLSLIYDYKEQKYNIIDAKALLAKCEKIQLDKSKMVRFSQIELSTSQPSRTGSIFDTNYSLGNKLEIKDTLNQIWNESESCLPIVSTSYLTSQGIDDVAKDVKQKQNISRQYICNNHIDNDGEPNLKFPLRISSQVAPLYDCPLQPISLVGFSENFNNLTYKQQGFPDMLLMRSNFTIKPTPIWQCMRKNWSATQEHLSNNNKHDLSRSMHANDSITTRPALLFNYEINQLFLFKDRISLILPRAVKSQPDIEVISEIYTTLDDETKKNQNHLLFDMYKNEITALSLAENNLLYSAGSAISEFTQSYLCKFPKSLLPEGVTSDPFLMPVNAQECHMNPNFYTLLKSCTKVLLKVQRENSYLSRVLSFQVPEQTFTKGDTKQNHFINFENREDCKAYISHEFDLSSKSTSLNIESTQPDKTRSILLSDKGLQMKYQLKGS